MALVMVRDSIQYFSSFGLYILQYARRTQWLSLWLGLAVSIFQFWIVYCTVRKKDFVALARVRVSSQYFCSL